MIVEIRLLLIISHLLFKIHLLFTIDYVLVVLYPAKTMCLKSYQAFYIRGSRKGYVLSNRMAL